MSHNTLRTKASYKNVGMAIFFQTVDFLFKSYDLLIFILS